MNAMKWFSILLVMALGLFSVINPNQAWLFWAFILACVLIVFLFSSTNKNSE